MTAAGAHDPESWWASLEHGGLLIAPARLIEHFGAPLPPLTRHQIDRLRREVTRMRDDAGHLGAFLDHVFEDLLGLDAAAWDKGNRVDKAWAKDMVTGERLRPSRIWKGARGAVLPVFVPDASQRRQGVRLGVGRSRRDVARVLDWLRRADEKLAVLTTGRQIRLIYAGADHDAFCQWDLDRWFEEGAPGPQITALRRLLDHRALAVPQAGGPAPLLAAVLDSRKGQGELSAVLGERVRLAVEHLIQAVQPALSPVLAPGGARLEPKDIYIAATRMVMRLVVILFAEARDLLPGDNPIYHHTYGLTGLREELDRAAGGRAVRLRHRHAAWPRLLALFRLVYHGSEHDDLPLPAYGGGLFEPGKPDDVDPVARAVAAFESPNAVVGDDVVHRILELLTRSRVKVRQGRRSTWIEAPVDFSDLSSEYIGILYEGLLDFELRRAPADDAVVFLGVGTEPALPFKRLDDMTGPELTKLFEKLKESASDPGEGGEGGEEAGGEEAGGEDADGEDADDAEAAGESDAADDAGDEPVPAAGEDTEAGAGDQAESADDAEDRDTERVLREAIQLWAERAVKEAKLVRYPRNDKDVRVREAYQRDVEAAARRLVRRVVLPGEWFLVRWGGTRKGSGTFYTRPQLAGPTVRRTLQPLAYDLGPGPEGKPRTPEEILQIKVCDPAMGSGSFLVAALRTLTVALFQSLHVHGRLANQGDGAIARLADGLPVDHPANETLPVPVDHETFEDKLTARLKRHVVERCLYGVDLDPVAVELARLALWIETMDRSLPFEFLDHKLKCGNALVGCWFDRFQDYPLMAWEREGGDKDHARFVHHFRVVPGKPGKDGKPGKEQKRGDAWTQAIKDRKNEAIKPELARLIESRVQPSFAFGQERATAAAVHDQARAIVEQMHALPVFEVEERARLYAELQRNSSVQALRRALDAWCAIWFWPGDAIVCAPTPETLLALPDDTAAMVDELARRYRFFHWELEFPDVFTAPGAGFHAVVGNPPWDIQKPSSMEFFSNLDPLYRTYTKQQGVARQQELFEQDAAHERAWIEYSARFKAMSAWVKHVARSHGDPADADDEKGVSLVRGKKSDELHELWRAARAKRTGYGDPAHPFRYQGSADINTYKMFLELGHALLGPGGGLGFLVPSGIYTDNGSQDLRRLFLDHCAWTNLYAFQNERFVFDGIDHRFKMSAVHVRKGGRTDEVLTRFRLGPGDSPTAAEVEDDLADDKRYLPMPVERIHRFSPRTTALLEVRSQRDLAILEKLYENGVLLGDQGPNGWGITYTREFDMTNDSKLFPPRPQWEAQGYRADEYGHWLKGTWRDGDGCAADSKRDWSLVRSADGKSCISVDDIDDVALPLYQGIMVQQFDFAPKRWLSGTGSRAKWEVIEWSRKSIGPQFLVGLADFRAQERSQGNERIGFRDIARSTDTRSMIASLLPSNPCGNKVPFLSPETAALRLPLVAVMNSFVFDAVVRVRLVSASLNYYILEELPLPASADIEQAGAFAFRLNTSHATFARSWSALPAKAQVLPWRRLWAVTEHERLRLRCILDAVVAKLYGLDAGDLAWILRDCDHPVEKVTDKPFSRTLDPKGFWRVDKERPPELRHTVLSLVAFHELEKHGLDAFLAMNDGEGWMLPETLRLFDYGLGHDERARAHQPVAAALGPRFLDWQLTQGVDESWDECARHAALIEQIVPTPRPAASGDALAGKKRGAKDRAQMDLFGPPPASQMPLFDRSDED